MNASPLKVSRTLSLPIEAATEAFAIVGVRGSGKTTSAKVLVEELVGVGQQVVVIDPLGVWWGLKSSADGKKPGLPFVVLGGDHGDVPLTLDAGEVIADLVVDEQAPIVIDLSHFRKGQQVRFVSDFLERLYHRNRDPLHVVVDEADLFSPQRARPETARVLGAMEDLARRGRARGLGVTVISQRPAALHKDVLTQASVLVSHRLVGPQDRKAIEAWVEAHGTAEQRAAFMASVASLGTGEAWWWSPAWLDLFEKVQTRKPRTFDSSATPKAGQVRIVPTGFATVDLDALQNRMAEVVDRAEQTDPKVLQRRIQELEGELDRARRTNKQVVEVPVEVEVEVERVVEVIPPQVQALLDRAMDAFGEISDSTAGLRDKVFEEHRRLVAGVADLPGMVTNTEPAPAPVRKARPVIMNGPKPLATPKPRPTQTPERQSSSDGVQIKAGARRILEMLARHHPMRMTKAQVGTLTGFAARKSGTFSAYQSALRTAGLIDVTDGYFTITPSGLDFVGVVDQEPVTVEEIRDRWRAALKKGARDMLDVLIAEYPNDITRDELAARVGLTVGAGTFSAYLSSLRTNGLAEVSGQHVSASETLFVTP